jgi:transcription elongation factor GreA
MSSGEMYLTKEGLEKLKNELDDLVNHRRKEIIEKIQIAKSYGDLSENAEYESAKSEQSFIEGRIEEIQEILKKAKIIKKTNGATVSIGSKVILEIEDGEEEYQIVGSREADPSERKISDESPIGQALLGKKISDIVEFEAPDGKKRYKIKKIA